MSRSVNSKQRRRANRPSLCAPPFRRSGTIALASRLPPADAECQSQGSPSFARLSVDIGSPHVDPKVSVLERAFELAKSGRVATIGDIRKQLRQEGYDDSVVDGGPSLSAQLRELIRAAHLEPGGAARPVGECLGLWPTALPKARSRLRGPTRHGH